MAGVTRNTRESFDSDKNWTIYSEALHLRVCGYLETLSLDRVYMLAKSDGFRRLHQEFWWRER